MQIDDVDKKIFEILKEDARISYTDLAKQLKISDVAAKKRVDKLISKGIIKNFTINIDYSKIGKPVHAFVLLRSSPKGVQKISEVVSKMPNVIKIYNSLGSFDFVFEVISESVEELRDLVESKIGSIKEVVEIQTLIVI